MLLHFESVSMKNRKEMEALQVYPAQCGFIESVSECLCEADQASSWHPVGICDGQMLIGFAMYGYALLEKLHREYDSREVYLSVYENNKKAVSLYQQIGFRFNGQYDTKGEKIMVYVFE